MKRNVKKAIENYDKTYGGNSRRGAFYVSDFNQLFKLSTPAGSTLPDLLKLTGHALKFGYMLGYRTAKREKNTTYSK